MHALHAEGPAFNPHHLQGKVLSWTADVKDCGKEGERLKSDTSLVNLGNHCFFILAAAFQGCIKLQSKAASCVKLRWKGKH